MKYTETGSTDPAFNLAFEEYLLENRTDDDYVILWQNDRTVVIGRNQNALEEINRDYVEKNGIRVVRRATGGGAVYHDLGNLNYSVITDDVQGTGMDRFTVPVCRALEGMGIHAETSGRNDITVDGKKISGVAQRIFRNRILHHGCILFDADTSVLSCALNPDPSKFESKSVKSVSSRVGNIRDFLDDSRKGMSIGDFRDVLRTELLKGNVQRFSPDDAEIMIINRIADEKYRTWEWTYGHSPKYTYKARKRFPEGLLDIRLDVREGIIHDVAFFGDYMAVSTCEPAVDALKGVRYEYDSVRAALEDSLLEKEIVKMFGGISSEEILEVMFL